MLTLPRVREELLAGVAESRAAGRLTADQAAQLSARFAAMTDDELDAIRERFAQMARALVDLAPATRIAFSCRHAR